MTRILVYSDIGALAESAADHIAAWIGQHVASHGRFALALSGGSTPRALYERLAAGPRRDKIPWDKVHVFWGDERAVPPDHPESSYRLAQETLLAKAPVPPANVHRLRGEADDLEAAAAEYEQTLRDYFDLPASAAAAAWPRLDLALLGMGPDGHTASLFPGSPALDESEKWAVATPAAPREPRVPRLTLTLPVLNHAAQVIFLVTGAAKADMARDVLGGSEAGRGLPAARVHVHPPDGSMIWMLDEAAASRLSDLPDVKWAKEDGASAGAPIHSGAV
jgi:6-phosphogluconolactonase